MNKQTKNSYKKFGQMVSEFGSNWKKIHEADLFQPKQNFQ